MWLLRLMAVGDAHVCTARMGMQSGNANPAARSLGSYRGAGEIVPFVSRIFDWAVVIATFFVRFEYRTSPLCPFDLLPSPKIEGN